MKYSSAQLRKNGAKWRGQLQYKDEAGKWRKVTRTLASPRKREAQKELEAWQAEMNEQALIEENCPNRTETVADYVSRYIEGRAGFVERSTLDGYRRILANHIAPRIGEILLDELTPDMVQDWVNDLSKQYAPVTVQKALVLLRSAMTQAVDRDRLLKNPTRTVKAPRKPSPKPNALDERGRATVLAVLDAAGLSPSMLGAKIALFTGMRQGEISGLRWRNVDVEGRTLEVREAIGHEHGRNYYVKEPKTGQSIRLICYPKEIADDLARRRAAMEAACAAAGVRFSGDLYVLGEIDGSFLPPHRLSKDWHDLAQSLKLKGTQGKRPTFHDLRHTYATVAVSSGIDVKTVSSGLGHSNAAMTLNTYASADPDAKRRAADAMGAAMRPKPRIVKFSPVRPKPSRAI